jgi:hypothetical protein
MKKIANDFLFPGYSQHMTKNRQKNDIFTKNKKVPLP